MWQRCFGKTIIMYKYVGVYILMLPYNSSSMCYLGNTLEINDFLILKIQIFEMFFCNEMAANFLHMY